MKNQKERTKQTSKYRTNHQRCSIKKAALEIFAKLTEKHLYQSLFLIKEKSLAQVFSCKFCKIFKSTFFTEHFRTIASENSRTKMLL